MSNQGIAYLNKRKPNQPAYARRKVTVRPLVTLWPYIWQNKMFFMIALVSLLLTTGLLLYLPTVVREIIDFGFLSKNAELLGQYFLLLIGITIAIAAFGATRSYYISLIGERVVAELRKAVFANVVRLDVEFFDQVKSGELISRLSADTTQIKATVGYSGVMAIRNFVLIIGSVAMMFYTSPRLTVFVLIVIPIIIVLLFIFGRIVRRKSRIAQAALADATAFATEAIGGARSLKSYTNESLVEERFNAATEVSLDAARVQILSQTLLTMFAVAIASLSIVVVLWLEAQEVLANQISLGTLNQFIMYAIFAATSFSGLSQVWVELLRAAGATDRLVELLTKPVQIVAPENPKQLPSPVKGNIQFKDMSFAYPIAPNKMVLEDINITFNEGERIAIVGPSGSGKSTLFSLMIRFFDPTKGVISMDGVNLKEADPFEIRKQVTIVPQEPYIFSESVIENLRFGKLNATMSEIEDAAKMANADEFINNLPQGYETILGERGITISGGQRQRLAIARAILKDAPILFLDEATSALDAESETLVQSAFNRLMKGRTSLVIAHRLATIIESEKIIVLDKGRIVEIGNHQSLMDKGGLYARLAKMQFEVGI